MRLIQHKREAYWFYRFLSLGYDRWVNPLFWTAAMRALALEEARLEPGLTVLDAGAGTGFTTEGIVARVDAARVTMLDQSPHQLARSRTQAGARGLPAGARGRREPAVRRRRVRPLRLGGLDRVLAGPAARHRRGLPRDARRRHGADHRPGAPGATASRAALAETWMLFPAAGEYTGWMERRGVHATCGCASWRPDWYRDQRAPYALAVSGVKPAPGPSPARARRAAGRGRRSSRAAVRRAFRGGLGRRRAVRADRALVLALRGAPRERRAPRSARTGRRPRAATAAPRRAPPSAVLWRFSRPHTMIGTALSIVGLYVIAGGRGRGARRRGDLLATLSPA